MEGLRVSVLPLALVALLGSGLFAADCNGNGREDADDLAAGMSADCNANGTPDECEGTPLLYSRTLSLPVARIPRHLATGDVDGDGVLDIVVGSRTSDSTLAVLRGLGRGEFALESTLSSDAGFHDMSLVDISGDGLPDVVVAAIDSIRIFESQGDGRFEEADALPVDGAVRALDTGDLDGDGLVDIVTLARSSDRMIVLMSRGGGRFEPPVTLAVGSTPADLLLDDYDADGALDAAIVNRTMLGVHFGRGDGDFAEAVDYRLPASGGLALVAGDLDGDRVPEIVVLTASQTAVFNNDGAGVFSSGQTFPSIGSVRAMHDVDGDGDMDLITGERPDKLVVRLNDAGVLAMSRETTLERIPIAVVAADHDGDGLAELAISRSDTSEIEILSPGARRSETSFERTQVALLDCADPRGCRPHGGAIADFNGDGMLDVIASITHPGSFGVVLNDGAGELRFSRNLVFGGEHPQFTTAADIDGDGDIDAVTCDNLSHTIAVHFNPGNGEFENPPPRYGVGTAPINVQIGDLDRDGRLDVVTANETGNTISILFGRADSGFDPRGTRDHRVVASPKSVVLADLDGDGALDIVSGNSASPNVSVFMNNGDGTLGPRTDLRISGSASYVAVGDLNADERPDIAAAMGPSRNCAVLLQSPAGEFTDIGVYRVEQPPYSVTLVDVNADDVLDIVTGSEIASSVTLLIGAGDGTFGPPSVLPGGLGMRFVLPGDIDLDGDIDFVTTDREGHTVTVLRQSSASEIPDFLRLICTPLDFHRMSAVSPGAGRPERFVKFILPAVPDAELPLTFQNTDRHALHEDFLSQVFPELFPALSGEDYARLVGRRDSRRYFAGAISRIVLDEDDVVIGDELQAGAVLFGFGVFADFSIPAEALGPDEVGAIHRGLAAAFTVPTLVYAPGSRAAQEVARDWGRVDFPVVLRDLRPAARYEAYTHGVGYGRVKLLDAAGFERANSSGLFGFQDILVIEGAPRDIEGLTSGLITGEPQGELSHLAVRTARRGTPNAYVRDALEAFAPLDGLLVRLEVERAQYRVREATIEEAEDWWRANRPTLSTPPVIDAEHTALSTLDEITAQERSGVDVVSRFGGKTSNLARLRDVLNGPFERYRADGFGVPVRYYVDFLRSNRIPSALDDSREVTYEEHLAELFESETFRTDSAARFRALEAFRDHAERHGVVPPGLVRAIALQVARVFGETTRRVRMRSSSNVEDAVEFNGAGLYDSTSACAADDLDADADGPSRCDAGEANERGIERALRRVWTSLWNFRAYEERAFYGLDQSAAAMGVLVSRAFIGERANGVAFTGNPTNSADRRYVVIAQRGEASVVSPEPGVSSEKNVLEVTDGTVTRITRARRSSLVAEGEFVLSDAHLEELGALMAHVDFGLPIDAGEHSRDDILLDFEFKIDVEGALAIKQVRPFLQSGTAVETPTFELVVPEDVVACGVFRPERGARAELELKSRLRFAGGTLFLPSQLDSFPAELVSELRMGAGRELASPVGDGIVRVASFGRGDGRETLAFEFAQGFELADGRRVTLEVSGFDFDVVDGEPIWRSRSLADDLSSGAIFVNARFDDGDPLDDVTFASCSYDELPLWDVHAELVDGSRVTLEERFLEEPRDTGPASLVSARVELGRDGSNAQTLDDYWRLVYSASRHNERVTYWVVLDPPLAAPDVEEPVHVLELVPPEPEESIEGHARYLDDALEELSVVPLRRYLKRLRGAEETPFVRGDYQGDGAVEVEDAVDILRYLFENAPASRCERAADVNDDGRINITDAIWVVFHLFGKLGPLPAPSDECGQDTTSDLLGCESFTACE